MGSVSRPGIKPVLLFGSLESEQVDQQRSPCPSVLMDGSPTWLVSSKEPTRNARAMGSIPGSGRSLGEGNAKPLQFSCLEKCHGQPMGSKRSQTPLSNCTTTTTTTLHSFFPSFIHSFSPSFIHLFTHTHSSIHFLLSWNSLVYPFNRYLLCT